MTVLANRLRTKERSVMGRLPKQDGTAAKTVRPAGGLLQGWGASRGSRGADRRRDLAEALGGHHEGTLQQLLVVVDQVGEPPPQHRHREDLPDAARELQ